MESWKNVPKPARVASYAFLAGLLFVKIFAQLDWDTAVISGAVVALTAALIAMDLPVPVKSGLTAGLIGVAFVLIYSSHKPAIALLAGLLGGLAAGLLAANKRHQDTPIEGAVQGGLSGLVSGLLSLFYLILVWLFVAKAAGVDAVKFAQTLQTTVPLAKTFGLTADIGLLALLSVEMVLYATIMGALAGAARGIPGQAGKYLLFGVLGLAAVLLPIINNSSNLQLLSAIIPVYVFILLALGLNIVVGYAGLLDLGYAAFFAIGAYTTALLSSPHLGINVNFWLVIWIAAAVAAVAGVILGSPTLPLRGDYLAIVTLGFGEIVPIAVKNLGGGGSGTLTLKFFNQSIGIDQVDLTGGTGGITAIIPPKLPGIGAFTPQNQLPWYFLLLAIMVLTIFFINRLRGSRQGRAWTAMREDELAADAMGINIVRTKLMAFAMGATFSGFAGAFYGAFIGAIFPSSFGFDVSIVVLCMVILGGLGNMVGVIVGGLLIMGADRMFLPEASNLIRDIAQLKTKSSDLAAYQDLTQLRLLLFGLVLVVMMLVRPEGLIPSARRRAELHPDADELRQENADLYDAERDPQLAGH